LSRRKIKIMYFYSDLYENERRLSKLSKKLGEELKGVKIHLVNVEDPRNEDITELYDVNMVPVMIFLTSKGEVAARRSVPLSEKEVIHEVTDRINRGELPNPAVEEARVKILEALKSVTQRNDVTQLIINQARNDLLEADSELEIQEIINSYVSIVNHTIHDLRQFGQVLQRFLRKHEFLV